MVDEALIEVLTAQMRVTSGGLHLEDALLNGEQGHIERAATEVEDEHVALSACRILQPQPQPESCEGAKCGSGRMRSLT